MNYPFFIILLGFLPSFIWLLFFLRKDSNPESKLMILKIFSFGMLSPLPLLLIFVLLLDLLAIRDNFNAFINSSLSIFTLYVFFMATAEEVLKYLAVQINLKNSELDEPIDAMIYMIVAGLGFAALENILILFEAHPVFVLPEIIILAFLRFISATFLHALCSGLIGYFLALSFFENKNSKKLLMTGLIIASLLHGLYNFAILIIGGILGAIIVIIIFICLFIFLLFAFKDLKKIKSICKTI